MNSRFRLNWILLLAMFFPPSFAAAQLEWDGGGNSNNWSDGENWDPDALPEPAISVVIDQNVNSVVDEDFTIKGLQMGSASAAYLNKQLVVDGGDIELVGSSQIHVFRGDSANSLHVTAGSIDLATGVLAMQGGSVLIDNGMINNGGAVAGHGRIHFGNSVSSAQTVFANNGVLEAKRESGVSSTERRTLTISAADNLARIDLDGINNDRTVNIREMSTLELDMAQSAFFGGKLNLEAGAILDSSYAFQAASGSVITVDAAATATASSDTATIRGSLLRMRNGSVLNHNSGRLVIASTLNANAGSSINMGTNTELVLGGTSTIDGDLSMGGGSTLTINADTVINTPSINLDGLAGNGVVNIGNDVELNINSSQINGFNNDFTGTLNVESFGAITMPGPWTLKGDINLNGSQANINGPGLLTIQGGISATGGGAQLIRSKVEFLSSGSTFVAAGANLRLIGGAEFQGGSLHTGEGDLTITDEPATAFPGVTFDGNTTFDMPNGSVTFGQFVQSSELFEVNSVVSVNAASFGEFGERSSTMIIDGANGLFDVNLTDPNASWTLHEEGRIHVTGGGGFTTSLAGSSIRVDGEIDVDKGTRFEARVDVTGNIDINQVGNSLNLAGGSASNPNRLSGGIINGPGNLSSGIGLSGFGTLNAPVAFGSSADLYAEGGAMRINSGILSARNVGARTGATITFGNPFDTSTIGRLHMDGGIATGGTITNSGVIEGHGLIQTAGLTNVERISASDGELIIDTASALDLDEGNAALIEAANGNLTIADPLTDRYGGFARVNAGRTLRFEQPWEIDGFLEMNGSTSTNPARLEGASVRFFGNVSSDQQSLITAQSSFRSTAIVSLTQFNDVLRLAGDSTIYSGARFIGGGELAVAIGSELTLRDNAIVGVTIDNRGEMFVEDFGSALVNGLELGFNSEIQFHIDSPVKHSELAVTNDVTLGGTLSVEILSDYEPEINDEFRLINADSVSSTFRILDLPNLEDGLNWRIDNTSEELWLRVVADAISGDFNGDGDYSCADVDSLVANIVSGSNDGQFDLTGDGQVNGQDLQAWLAKAGAAELASGNPYLPGDANLDGSVDVSDFNVWNANKFTTTSAWCLGDFNADGVTDASDFNVWNSNKFNSSDSQLNAVPEPSSGLMIVVLAGLVASRLRRRF